MRILRNLQFWLFLCFCTYLSLTPAPPQVVTTISDKLLHTLGYLALYLSASLAWPSPEGRSAKLLGLFGYSLLIEILQHFIPNRGFSLLDLLANVTGLMLGLILLRVFRGRLVA